MHKSINNTCDLFSTFGVTDYLYKNHSCTLLTMLINFAQLLEVTFQSHSVTLFTIIHHINLPQPFNCSGN